MSHGWRNLSFVLGALCSWQAWRAWNRPASEVHAEVAECAPAPTRNTGHTSRDDRSRDRPDREPTRATTDTPSAGTALFGIPVPPWARSLLLQPGEDLRDYRDRMIPLAQMAVAPQRARIARSKEDIIKVANLDGRQLSELDATTKEAATAIQDRLFNAVLSGELSPSTFKPMAGVAVARDVLDLVDRANKRFVGSLREDQRAKLAAHPFDFGDYLLFSTRWEDAISGL